MDKKIHTADSSNISNRPESDNSSKEIYLVEVFAKIWYKRKFIILFTSVFILLGLFVAFAKPASYTADCTVVPQLGSERTGGIGGIASMMGFNLNNSMTGETLSPRIYPQIINSVPFCREIMDTPIVVERSHGDTITLYDYYSDKKYRPINVMGNIIKYTIGLPSLIVSAVKSDANVLLVHSDVDAGQLIKLTKNERNVIKSIRQNIIFNSNPKDGYITLGYSFSEPQTTAIIAENVCGTLEKYVASFKSQKQLDNYLFVKENYESTRKDFLEKQAELAAFQDANRDLTSAVARSTERHLNSEYQLAGTVYSELARQLEQAKISLNESTPILTVIDPVVVPNQKSAPRKSVILIGYFVFGLIFSIAWVFIKTFIVALIDDVKKEELKFREQK